MPSETPSESLKLKKGIYFFIGTLALVAAVAGMFLPLIPTTPFVLLAAACYYRSSERVYDWMASNERFGEIIVNYDSGKGLSKAVKFKAIALMWLSITVSVYFFVSNMVVASIMYAVAVAVTVYLVRLPTLSEG